MFWAEGEHTGRGGGEARASAGGVPRPTADDAAVGLAASGDGKGASAGERDAGRRG